MSSTTTLLSPKDNAISLMTTYCCGEITAMEMQASSKDIVPKCPKCKKKVYLQKKFKWVQIPEKKNYPFLFGLFGGTVTTIPAHKEKEYYSILAPKK